MQGTLRGLVSLPFEMTWTFQGEVLKIQLTGQNQPAYNPSVYLYSLSSTVTYATRMKPFSEILIDIKFVVTRPVAALPNNVR